MHEWTVTIETEPIRGADEHVLELFLDRLGETAAIGPAVSVSDGALGATFTIEADDTEAAGHLGLRAFGHALGLVLRELGVDSIGVDELHIERVHDRELVTA